MTTKILQLPCIFPNPIRLENSSYQGLLKNHFNGLVIFIKIVYGVGKCHVVNDVIGHCIVIDGHYNKRCPYTLSDFI